MKIVVSVPDPGAIDDAERSGADLIEIRRDLMQGHPEWQLREIRDRTRAPWIATVRTKTEGGLFSGTPEEWRAQIDPLLPLSDMIDIEYLFREYAPEFRAAGKVIIASYHTQEMPSPDDLVAIELRLKAWGDIPKIVVQPRTEKDVISLLTFTLGAEGPMVVSIMGCRFRYARALLPLFGSDMVFCHAGTPTAEGQYHVQEFRQLMALLTGEQKNRNPG
jgi:3-dehydroquinate dehydratase-1